MFIYLSLKVCLQLGSHEFLVDLFVVPLCGAEIVLGVQWMKSLGPILTNYETLTMTFIKDGQIIQLTGESQTCPEEASLHQLKLMVSTNAVDTMLHLHILPSDPTIPPIPTSISWLELLLNNYTHLFTEPTLLPPPAILTIPFPWLLEVTL